MLVIIETSATLTAQATRFDELFQCAWRLVVGVAGRLVDVGYYVKGDVQAYEVA